MSEFIINGPSKLMGEVTVSGSKNAALPIIAATLLAKGEYRIDNVPEITDIFNLLDIINDLGGKTSLKDNICVIDSTGINSVVPNPKKVRNIRASILLAGPILARFNEVKIAHPGGCFIGARPIQVHLEAFEKFGAQIDQTDEFYVLKASKLRGAEIISEFSVTGTENALCAAVLAEGTTTIKLAACEPHVVDLCNFLISMGADIKGVGSHELVIVGKKSLHSTNHTIIPDQIEAGTFALAAAASRGEVKINGFVSAHHDLFLKKLKQANVNFELIDDMTLQIKPSVNFKAIKLQTNIYPGFPTDLQAPFGILLTQAEGTSEIYETIFEGRLNYINELNKMGANGVIKNSHEATITGPTPLFGTRITSLDLRAGATLIIAAILASGESIIENATIIDRGYENIETKLRQLGVDIKRVEKSKTTATY